MDIRVVSFIAPILMTAGLLSGCGPMSAFSWATKDAPKDFVAGTRVLAEVIHIVPRQSVVHEEYLFGGWRDTLISVGYSDSDIVDGSEIIAWAYCYGHNSGVGLCAHHGHYLAHVPEQLRTDMHSYSNVGNGDLIEIELFAADSGRLVGKVVGVYREWDDWQDCREASLEVKHRWMYAALGPPQARWIECDNLESDGWLRSPVRAAPVSSGRPVSIWIKVPKELHE